MAPTSLLRGRKKGCTNGREGRSTGSELLFFSRNPSRYASLISPPIGRHAAGDGRRRPGLAGPKSIGCPRGGTGGGGLTQDTSKETQRFDRQRPVGRIVWKQPGLLESSQPSGSLKALVPRSKTRGGAERVVFIFYFAAEKFYKANPRSLMPPRRVFFFLFQVFLSPPPPSCGFLVCLVYCGKIIFF